MLLVLAQPASSQPGSTAALAQAAKLEGSKKYESAYQILDKADPKDQQPEVFLQKEKLLLDYYLLTLGFRGFALKDLAPGETVEQLRGKEGNYNMHLVDIPQRIGQLKKRFPQDYRLHKGLADYYYQMVMCHCGQGDKTDAELLNLVVKNYEQAHAHQLGDFMSHYAVGYAHLVQNQAQLSVAPLEKSIALNPQYPTSHYNLAYALLQLQKPAEATPHAQTAFQLYTEPDLKADAARMLGQLYSQQQQPAEARKMVQQSLELQPQNYASLRSMLELAVADRSSEATAWATRLYQLNPADDQMFSDIMDIYQAQNQWAEAESFFSGQVAKAPNTPEAQGLLHFYVAILNMQLKRPKVARPHFLAAQTHLKKVSKPDNPLFQTIKRGLAETKP
ncbi:tetratricopeptide repeat protein [Hymenobacter arizonensis]|uniref:Tetratricopeptide repeat-containing protein n=1 Tax=Hymenobacter arizonensis TaxID=1227077 RepID=A0A1I6ADX2_HYMAR|nr:tetratricopeptide repeat protein [Hymenobacter arizonensis]SFQ66891.1 Tetratricopeptide repeat-containing protein [Hymenobacter arizonensis]